ncbi:DUF4139 domain-containing protein [Flavobacterium sp. JP2137]|uniref:DUF4139 domain-containing protein n=1 Tax=Flavobacterium sp. JP2137 TaxID=3414510 RepID=UPI003D2FCA38
MKHLMTLFALSLIGFNSWAQKPLFTPAKLEAARVYYNGAEMTQNAALNLPKGNSEVVITNIANSLNENSIQIGSTKDVTVMSVQFSNAYIEEYDNAHNSPLTKPLRDSIAAVEIKLEMMTNSINADLKTVQLLDNSTYSESKKEFALSEMSKWVDYYKNKRQELENGIYHKKKEKEKIELHWNNLKSKLNFGLDDTDKTSNGKLILQVMNNKAGTVPFQINYVTNNAQWVPFYDLRIDKINQPIKVMYKAQLVQTSGVDWRNVKLRLTSGVVNQTNRTPTWNRWFVDYEPEMSADGIVINTQAPAMKRTYTGAASRISADEVNRSNYAPPAEQVSYRERQTIAEYTSVNISQLNVTFDIDIPYTILTNGKRHSVDLKNFELPATYLYYSAPKLDLNAYLVATVKDYGSFNLLPGEANVIFDGMHVGKTQLNTENSEEELKLNLGKDTKIGLTRTLIADKSGTKTLSSKKTQQFVYDISVRNNKQESVEIKVEDQFPISSNSDIEIELLEKEEASIDSEKGLLSWTLKLKPNETKKIRFSYQLRSNKDKAIIGF